ncbi:uncharacterized protein BX664DRAFT_289216 [Halteromyces radiatus]|uniref:uncharacterized protein n=1 Tax=Halteromyces radiatus TaxID=101107 RepID=UPI00221E6F3A|nr:uncharacterized protein BX664DRAFT_289216 [Halteromyces radiatus]KAI8099225.1 hypothetical protein BX664DRAFT_289216 [Halteromyces radiatus]
MDETGLYYSASPRYTIAHADSQSIAGQKIGKSCITVAVLANGDGSDRDAYYIKDDFQGDVANKIATYLPTYQKHIKSLKDDGYTVIGYIRKSPETETMETRHRLLHSMSSRLQERSLVDMVFASSCCRASDAIEERDLDNKSAEKLDVAGDTQEMLTFISGKTKVCLVILDYAGLSTDCADLRKFLGNYQQIKKIVVDMLPYTNEVNMYDCSQLLQDPDKLKVFDCRKRPTKEAIGLV